MTRGGEIPDTKLDAIAAELQRLGRESSWSRTLAIGEVVLKHFFDGNLEEWRTHRRHKHESIRRLARRPTCPLGRSALNDAVAVFVTIRELPSRARELTPSHVAVLVGLEPADRLRFVERALEEALTAKQLRDEVRAFRRRGGERRGRPRHSEVRTVLSRLEVAANRVEVASKLLETANEIDRETFHRIKLALRSIEREVNALGARASKLLIEETKLGRELGPMRALSAPKQTRLAVS